MIPDTMNAFVLDTDILTLFQRSHAKVMARVAEHAADEIAISVVTVEEQLCGWYAQLRKAKGPEKLAWAYQRLAANVRFLPAFTSSTLTKPRSSAMKS